MNRLVIIGNGFDLAHGLKTSYQDFINWYWNQWGIRLINSQTDKEQDVFCIFNVLDSDFNYRIGNDSFYDLLHAVPPSEAVVRAKSDNLYAMRFKYTSHLFERINQSIETKGWVDIENEYYHLLIIDEARLSSYQVLNNHLDILREKLIEYLQTLEYSQVQMVSSINGKIYRRIEKGELSINYSYLTEEELSPSNIMLLNFNYTKTPEMYLTGGTSINYIHGRLDNPKSVIFGYGDELDEDYKRLRNLNDNECLRHVKSIRYLEEGNYRRMLEFIQSGPFQVCIMGHSCGNSDRTLLNTLFEHPNCVSIKPYYYQKPDGTDNYIELVQNISRNFNDMKLMRDRVVCKPNTEPLVSQ